MEYLAKHAKTLGVLADLLSFIVAFYLTYALLAGPLGHQIFAQYSERYFTTEVLCLTSWSLSLAFFVEYPSRRTTRFLREVRIVLTANVIAILILTLSAFLFKIVNVSRLFVCVYLISVLFLMFLNRYAVRCGLYVLRKSGWDTRTRIIVGATPSAWQYLLEVTQNKRSGTRVLGYVGMDQSFAAIPRLGDYADIDQVLKQTSPDGVVIALRLTHPAVESIIRACEKQGISVELLLDSLAFRIASSTVQHGARVSSLWLSAIPHSPVSLLVKRMTDIVFSLIGCVLLFPVFVITAAAIKFEDGGPIFFRQQRVGLHNKPFWMYKFRSMRVDAEALQQTLLHLNEMSGPVFKMTNDPRVTRVGKWIRRLSIDELPQLFNVLMGNMSLFGPRPPLPAEVSSYQDEHRRRLSVKPGLTCLWQVSGRNEIDFEQWMNLDLTYIDNWTYLQDLKIMFRTIPAVLRRTGAK